MSRVPIDDDNRLFGDTLWGECTDPVCVVAWCIQTSVGSPKDYAHRLAWCVGYIRKSGKELSNE